LSKQFFISHSSKDKTIARRLKKLIESTGHSVWLDEQNLRYGSALQDSINQGISESTDFILLASEDSMNSEYVWEEIHQARHRFGQTGPGVYVIKFNSNVKLPLWLQNLLFLSLDDINLKIRLRKFFKDTTEQSVDELALEEFLTLLGRQTPGDYKDGFNAAEAMYEARLQVVGSLLRNSKADELSRVVGDILNLGVFKQVPKSTGKSTWVNLSPGIFEMIFSVPMRIPPVVEFTNIPENLIIEQEHVSNVSVRVKFIDKISGLPTNDVPFAGLGASLGAEL
jgi:uncharacterized protein (DUF2164 family)